MLPESSFAFGKHLEPILTQKNKTRIFEAFKPVPLRPALIHSL